MELTIDVGSYFDQDDIRDMVEDEMRRVIRYSTERRYGTDAFEKMVAAAAYDIVKRMVEDQTPEVFAGLAKKTRDIIEDLQSWHVFSETEVRTSIGVTATRKTRGLQMLEKELEELQPYLKERARELLDEKLGATINADLVLDAVTDAFYEKLCEQLKGGN